MGGLLRTFAIVRVKNRITPFQNLKYIIITYYFKANELLFKLTISNFKSNPNIYDSYEVGETY